MENNFLFLEIGAGLPLSIVKKLIKKFEIKHTYATAQDRDIDSSLFSEPPIYLWDAFYGNYPEIEELKPIDRTYENPIAEYSVEILHQMSRHGNLSLEKRISLYYTHLKFWDTFLETRKINFVVFSGVPHETYNFIIYLLCKTKKIRVCMSYADGYKKLVTPKAHYMLSFLEDHTTEVKEKFEELKEIYRDVDENEITPSEYAKWLIEKTSDRFKSADKSNTELMNPKRITIVKRYFGDPQENFKRLIRKQVSLKGLLGSYWRYRKGLHKTKELINAYEKIAVEPDFSDKYFFYALHYQPECTSSPLGGMYANQLLAIQMIAYNLPEGYWLYVKEHPSQSPFGRETSYYEELNRIPKVKIISQKITSEQLMKHAIAMATLTGTVLYESQIIQKPCLCLGYTPLEILDGVYKINSNKECKEAIDEILMGNTKPITLINLRLFLKAMEEICFAKTDEEEYYNKLLQYINVE